LRKHELWAHILAAKQREEEQRDKEPSSSKKQSKKIILLSAKKRLREIRLEGVVLLQSIATLSSSIPIANINNTN